MSISLNDHENRIKRLEVNASSGSSGVYWCTGNRNGEDICGSGSSTGGFNTGFVSKNGASYTLQPGKYIIDMVTTCGARGEAVDAYCNVKIVRSDGTVLFNPTYNGHAVWWNSDDTNYFVGFQFDSVTTIKIIGSWWGPVSPGAGMVRITKIS